MEGAMRNRKAERKPEPVDAEAAAVIDDRLPGADVGETAAETAERIAGPRQDAEATIDDRLAGAEATETDADAAARVTRPVAARRRGKGEA
jgi:hypothetical protein